MADLKTTNIFGDAYINNKVGIATNAPATRLQIGQLSPTAATEGIQFGDDTGARLYRDTSGRIVASNAFRAGDYISAGNYLQTLTNLIYPASQTATQRLEVGNASGNAWIDGLTIAQGGNVTVYNNLTVNNAATVTNDLTVNGNTYLGNAGGDTVFVNDIIRIGATDSGDASLFFGEGGVAGSDYGARWYWDSGYTFIWHTRNAGTDTQLFNYVTNDLSYVNWNRNFNMQNYSINYNAQIHFNAGTRFVGQDTNYLVFRSDSTSVGGIRVQDGGITTKGYIGYWDSSGGGILNNTGNWAVRYNFGNTNSGGTLFGDWVVNGNISATNLSGTNTGDQSIGNGTITIAAGTGVGVGTSNTFTTNQSGATTVTVTNTGVTSNVAGTGISLSGGTGAVTITNSSPNATHTGDVTGATTLTIANDAVTTVKILNSNVTNAKLANSSVTIGSTAVSLGATVTTFAGLTSVTSTTFVGALTGNATNITAYTINQNVGTANSPTFAGLTVAGGNATIYRDLIVNGGASNPYGNRIIVQGTAATYTLQDSTLRPTVYLNGDYPVLTLNATATTNANHGPTLQFAFNGLTTGGATSRQIVIGANGVGSWLDFGFSGGANGDNSSYNPHNGISGYNGVTAMRLFSNGLLVGSTGAYPNNITSISYALDVRGTGYFSSTLTVGGNISAANLSGTNTGDQSIGNGTITIAAGTGIGVGTSNTFTMNQSGATTVTVTNSGVTSNVAGTGISVSGATGAVTITNSSPNATHTGDVTGATALTIANDAVTTVKILNANVTNAKLANSSLTIGSTAISLGATATTIAGLTSVTSTTFVGALTGNATTATALTSMNISQFTNNSGYLTSAVTSLAGTTNRITVSGATGAVTLNLPQDIHTGASPTFAGLSLTSVSTTGATITNLTGAYQNTSVYDSAKTQSATPSRGIRAPASSIQFTDSYAIAPFWTYRSTGDWPVPYGIGWGTGGESSGIFQRYASNGSSFGDMIFYTGNDGSGAFSFRRHTWEGTAHFAAGSGELNTELFRVDWSGNVSMLGTLNGSANSATLYPNNGPYGSWKIGGTRGGWYGIEFESGTILMANSSESGFYRNGVGWQMWWSGGTGYVQKGGSGGGTQATILESSNYTSYTPGLGTNNTLTGINTINNTSNTVINTLSGNLGLTMFQATAGTDAYMTFHIGSDYAAYFGLGGAENDLVYGGWSAGNNRHRILHSGNATYAWNMNQFVRTTDTCSFAGLTVSNTINGSVTGNAGTATSLANFTNQSGARYTTDFNSIVTTGFFNAEGTPTNSPGGSYGQLISVKGIDTGLQIYGGYVNDNLWFRGWHTSGGTFTAWRTVIHSGNIASQTVATAGNATTAGGLAVHGGTNNEANKIVRTDGNGYINAGWINTPSGDMPDTQSINRIYCSDDQYIRYKGVADFKQQIGLTYKNATPRSANTTDTNYWTGVMGWASTDFNTMITWGSGFIDSWASPGNSPGAGFGHFVGLQSLHYTNGDTDGTDNYGYQLVAGGGVNSPLFLRVNWGSAGSWKTMLDSLNFNSYSPSLTGNGASGTWSINVTGNAGGSSTSCSGNAATATALTSMNISQFTNNSGYLTSVTNISGNAATATLATKASTLSQGGGTGTGMTFNWSGQGGQPTWLWGSNDGTNIYVWNPSNFSVNYATSAGTATSATTATNSTQLGGVAAGSYVTLTGTQTLTNKTVSGTFSGVMVENKSVQTSISGALTIDVSTANVHVISLTSGANVTSITYNNRAADPSVNTILLVLKYAGSATVSWTSVVWANGTAPTLTGVNGYADVYALTSYKGTTGSWIGTVVSQNLVSTNL